MTQRDETAPLKDMLDAAREAIGFAKGRTRADLHADRSLQLTRRGARKGAEVKGVVMKRRTALFFGFFGASMLAAGPAAAAWFLTLETPQGQTQTIELQTFNLGGETPETIGSATGGASAGKIKFNEFTITKKVDASSPVFFKHCAAGVHYKTATLYVRKSGGDPSTAGKPFLKYTLHDVVVTNANAAGHGAKFSFGRAEVENAPTPTPTPAAKVVKPGSVAPRK